jgi:hypothetical protein
MARYEGYYASVLYTYLASLGLDLTPEDSSNAGRLDLAVRHAGQLYLFEFKVVELAPDGSACSRSRTAAMPTSTAPRGLPMHLIGIEFSRERRTVVGFEVEQGRADEGLATQDCLDGLLQLRTGLVLQHIGIGASVEHPLSIMQVAVHRQRDDPGVGGDPRMPSAASMPLMPGMETSSTAKVGLVLASQADGRAALAGFGDDAPAPMPRKQRGQPLAEQHVIVAEEYV